jgi:signal transduction histidine kinase
LAVLADPGGLRQVLSNLLDNALRHTPDGGRIAVIMARATTPDNGKQISTVELLVRDNGVGIPRDALTRIFERFYRVDPARSRAEGGTGLGLSIVKHLIDRMDGDVFAESELGKGTTIRIRLPAATIHV